MENTGDNPTAPPLTTDAVLFAFSQPGDDRQVAVMTVA
jgi:hypothetical protein